MKLWLRKVRISYPSIFKPDQFDADSKLQYKADFLFIDGAQGAVGVPNDDGKIVKGAWVPVNEAVKAALKQVAIDKWKGEAGAIFNKLKAQDKLCYRNGDDKTGKDADAYNGNYWLAARADGTPKDKPWVYDKQGHQLQEDTGIIYGGCYVNAVVDIWAQDNKWGKRINCKLLSVMFNSAGDSFGGGARQAEDDFADLIEEPGSATGFGEDTGSEFDDDIAF